MSEKNNLIKKLIIEAKSDPFISFDRFMDLALYDPDHGYYLRPINPFGKSGDFITSPMISNLFGKTINRALNLYPAPLPCIAEVGPGQGHLMHSILEERPSPTYLIEKNPYFKKLQQNLFEELPVTTQKNIHWTERIPNNFEGAIITHELFDAFPVHRVLVKNQRYHEMGVTVDEKFTIKEAHRACPKILENICKERKVPLINDYMTEISTTIEPWIEEFSSRIQNALWILIDYGYERHQLYHPNRSSGTLRSYRKHQEVTGQWNWVGEQDITASVDFDLILGSCVNSGWSVDYFGTQHEFLANHGIIDLINKHQNTSQYLDISTQCKQLMTEPLGTVMKVAIMTKGPKFIQKS